MTTEGRRDGMVVRVSPGPAAAVGSADGLSKNHRKALISVETTRSGQDRNRISGSGGHGGESPDSARKCSFAQI